MALYKWTKPELVEAVSEDSGVSSADVKRVLAALDSAVAEAIGNCERVQVAGVTIEPKLRAARKKRMGRNPQTGEEVQIGAKPASVRIAARVSRALKDKAPSTAKLRKALA
jgi:nucleoid DNA-binding protein